MNHSYQKEIPDLVSNRKLGREQPLIRKSTTIGANRIRLTLPEACFFEDDCIEGTLLLDLKTRINAKKITLQFIGELSYLLPKQQGDSPAALQLNSNPPLDELIDQLQLSSPKENKTLRRSITDVGRITLTTKTQERNNSMLSDNITSPSNRPLLRRSMSGAFVRNKKFSQAQSLLHSVSKVYPLYNQKNQPNTDIFCHYRVPLYTFKQKCPPGRYRLPFSFEFDDLILPTTNFSRENLKLFIKYLVIAEVEEDDDEDSCYEQSDQEDDEEEGARPKRLFFERRGNLKCQAVIEILWNYAIHMRESALYSRVEVSKEKTIKLLRYFCSCFSYTASAVIKIPKTIITLGEKVPFSLQLSHVERDLKFDVLINLIEDISNPNADVNDRNIIKLTLTTNSTKGEANCIDVAGEIDFGVGVNVCSLISNEWNINHSLEFRIVIKKLLIDKVEKIIIPCLIVPNLTPKQIRRLTGEKAEGMSSFLDETIDEDILQLPHCKFKLGKRFDLAKEKPSKNFLD